MQAGHHSAVRPGTQDTFSSVPDLAAAINEYIAVHDDRCALASKAIWQSNPRRLGDRCAGGESGHGDLDRHSRQYYRLLDEIMVGATNVMPVCNTATEVA